MEIAMAAISYPRATGHCVTHHIPAGQAVATSFTIMADPGQLWVDHDRGSYTTTGLIVSYLNSKKAAIMRVDLTRCDVGRADRNNGLFIFNGNRVIDLDYSVDDYGALPREFNPIEE